MAAMATNAASAFEKRMRNQVEAIVSSIVGAGRARVQLTAEFDYNKVTQTSDRFDPEGRVLRSSQSREESTATAGADGAVTVNNELPAIRARTPALRRRTRARSPRKPTIMRFPAPPRPK